MKLAEAERICTEIETLANQLSESHGTEDAELLIRTCRFRSGQMHGRFGNVAEQLGRISDAARAFTKARIYPAEAEADLSRAMAQMRGALGIHRRFNG